MVLLLETTPLIVLVVVVVKLREAELDVVEETGDDDLLQPSNISCLTGPFSIPDARVDLLLTGITWLCGLRLGDDGNTCPGTGFCHAPIVGPMVLVTEFNVRAELDWLLLCLLDLACVDDFTVVLVAL